MNNQRKDLFNYAERLDKQLTAMLYNPSFRYVLSALYDLMEKKGVYTEHFRKKDDESEPYVDLNTYNELMQAAKLFSFVGKTPREIPMLHISLLNGTKTEYELFTLDEAEQLRDKLVEEGDERDYYFVWLHVGNNKEICIAALVYSLDGTVAVCPDEMIRSSYGSTENLPVKKPDLSEVVDGYEYVSGMFDYLYDPSENFWWMKDFDNFIDDFFDEEEEIENEYETAETEEAEEEFDEEELYEVEETELNEINWEELDSIFEEEEDEEDETTEKG